MPAKDTPKLTISEVVPDLSAPLPAGAAIRVRFDQYLDPASLGTIEVASGDLTFSAGVGYDPVDRALVIIPELNLRPQLGYRLTVTADDRLRGLDGRTLDEDLVLDFTVSPAAVPPPPTAPSFAEVQPILEAKCSCHGPDTYPPMTEEALISGASKRQPGEVLVVPGRPLASHLIQRVLPDYPGVRGQQMPLQGSLEPDEIRTLVGWVEVCASRYFFCLSALI